MRRDDIRRYVPDPAGGLTGFDASVREAMRDAPRDTGPRTLVAVTAATVASAALGSLATTPGAEWYRRLDLPPWQPPPAAFPVVWTALYADIIAASTATLTGLNREGRADEAAAYRRALAVNLVLNTAWSAIFWRGRRLGLAAAEAAVLAASSADLARRAGARSPARGRALAPYAVWCAFAAVLSAEIARRNRPS